MAPINGMFQALFVLASLTLRAATQYTLVDDYSGAKFFDMMDFFTDPDPTKGMVAYQSREQAQSQGLISADNGSAIMRVSSGAITSPLGRNSIRVQSSKTYTRGLFVAQIAHSPAGCANWPAFWTTSKDITWPNGGEIDILEGVNEQKGNYITLHTGGNNEVCMFPNQTQLTHSHMTTLGSDINSPGQAPDQGAATLDNRDISYGDAFNANGGGIYAMEWTSQAISVYFFPQNSAIPSDVLGDSPNPANWGPPTALFPNTKCNIDNNFKSHQIIFDMTLCGSWASSDWATSSCASKAPTCEQYVRDNPSAFKDSYFEVKALKVYSKNGNPAAPAAAQPASSAAAVAPSAPAATTVTPPTAPLRPTTVPMVLVTSTVTAAAVEVTQVAALQANEFGTGSSGIAQRRQHPRHLK